MQVIQGGREASILQAFNDYKQRMQLYDGKRQKIVNNEIPKSAYVIFCGRNPIYYQKVLFLHQLIRHNIFSWLQLCILLILLIKCNSRKSAEVINIIITFMSKKLKEVNATSSRQGQQQPKQPLPLPKDKSTKTVQILMNNLDQQIKQSYRKLKISRHRNNPSHDRSFVEEVSMTQGHSPTFDHSYLHKRTVSNKQQMFESPFSKKYANLQSYSQSVLLDNHQLMEYINLVYQMYDIDDPLQEQHEFTTGKKTVETQVRGKKEVGSASTIKNSYIYRSNEVAPFDAGEQSERQRKEKKIKLTSSRAKQEAIQNKEETNKSNQKIRLKREESFDSPIEKRAKTQIEATGEVIAQTFRFCFMCEQPILQSNLSWHQKSCLPLQQAIGHKTLDQLVTILDEKIRKFRKQINLNLINKSEERVKEEFNRIRAKVKTWMELLPPQEVTNQKSNSFNIGQSQYRWSFNNIQSEISNSSWSSYQSIRKLQWFSKLRQSIGMKYYAK